MTKSEKIYSLSVKAKRMLRRKYKNEADEMLDDLVADSVCKALEKIDTLKNDDLIQYWFLSIVHNHAVGTLKRRRIYVEFKDYDCNLDPRGNFDREGLERILVDNLNGKQLKVVWMILIECMSLDEIVKSCGWNYNTVKANWRHGWLKIKDQLKEWYE